MNMNSTLHLKRGKKDLEMEENDGVLLRTLGFSFLSSARTKDKRSNPKPKKIKLN